MGRLSYEPTNGRAVLATDRQKGGRKEMEPRLTPPGGPWANWQGEASSGRGRRGGVHPVTRVDGSDDQKRVERCDEKQRSGRHVSGGATR